PHRVGVVVEPVDEFLDALVDDRVVRDVVDPRVELRRRRQLAVEQQVRGLEEGALLGELLDGIAAVAQDALVAVDVAHRAPARRRVEEPRVVGEEPRVVDYRLDLAEIDGPDGPVLDRDLVLLPGAVVGDRERVLGHGDFLGNGSRKITTTGGAGGSQLPTFSRLIPPFLSPATGAVPAGPPAPRDR